MTRKRKPSFSKLFLSLGVDAVGMGTYFIPVIGETADLILAPISAIIIYKMYNNTAFTVIGAIEEIAPGTDFIPTATLAWLYQRFIISSKP